MLRLLTILFLSCATALQSQERVPTSQAEITLSFAPLVRAAAPAVVNIYAQRVVQDRSPFSRDPFFQDFFRDFGAPQPRVQNSLGSGVILSADGVVVSNYHVVGMATAIRVVLTDRREYAARVLLADEEADLAILKIDASTALPHLTLRDSDTVEVGELVLAIGNPFGVGQTVSSGIVSGLARTGTATGTARGYFIQTDAPINPGNSGGALIDMRGQLIGINTSILTRSGGSNGIGFAIPAALVAQFVAQAQAGNDRFVYPWAGVTGQTVDPALTDVLGLTRPEGVILSDLHPASPFAAAGFTPGDVVLAVDGQPVNTPAEMAFRMSVRGIGQTARVTRLSGRTVSEVAVAMIAPPDDPPRDIRTLGNRELLTGLTVARINPALSAELGLGPAADGVVVLETGRLGARAGLEPADIILAIGRTRIDAPSQVGPALVGAGSVVQVEVLRGQRRISLRFRV